jgi:hypothetical protein
MLIQSYHTINGELETVRVPFEYSASPTGNIVEAFANLKLDDWGNTEKHKLTSKKAMIEENRRREVYLNNITFSS